MNKFLIILLAVCLVSVHAFVKRDAPAAGEQNTLEKFQKDLSDKFKEFTDEIQKSLDPKALEKVVDDITNGLKKTMDAFKTTDKTTTGGAA